MITCFSPPSAGHLAVFGMPVTPANHGAIKARLFAPVRFETNAIVAPSDDQVACRSLASPPGIRKRQCQRTRLPG